MTETIYHGSHRLFDRFSLEYAGRSEFATNGRLGIWVTPLLQIATACGGRAAGYLYEIAPSTAPIKRLPLKWLKDQHEIADRLFFTEGLDAAIAHYDRIRLDFLAQGFGQLWITEKDDFAPTRVYLDPDDIEILSVREISKCQAA